MKIPQQILRIWNKKHSRGDVSRLIHYTQVSKPTIIKAIRHGQANEEMILKISRYYSEKKTTVEQDIIREALKMLSDEPTKNY